jgi:dihydrofolate reductase
MTRVAYYVATSLDGFIAGPNHELDWLEGFGPPTDYGYDAFYAGVDALVMGRETYDVTRGFGDWPYLGKPCCLLTHGAPGPVPPGADVQFTAATPTDLLQRWHAAGLKRVWLVGGGQVAAQFLAEGCLHELIVTRLPVTLGAGRPLLAQGPGLQLARWRLVELKQHANGVVETHHVALTSEREAID